MERREFLKTTSGFLATLPFIDLGSVLLPAQVDKQVAMLPNIMPYYDVHVFESAKEELIALASEFTPAEWCADTKWANWWFKTKIGADRFRRMLKDRNIKSWESDERIAVDPFTEEQWQYWLKINNANAETYYYRHMDIMDQEELRLTEDAEALGRDEFLNQFQSQSRHVGEAIYEIVKDGEYLSYEQCTHFLKELEPYIEGSVLRKISYSHWERLLFIDEGVDTCTSFNEDIEYCVHTPAQVRKVWR